MISIKTNGKLIKNNNYISFRKKPISSHRISPLKIETTKISKLNDVSRIWAGKGKRRRCKETASIEGGQFFDNCSVKTGEAAANRRQSRPDTIFAFVFNPCIALRQFRLRGPMGHNGGLTKG